MPTFDGEIEQAHRALVGHPGSRARLNTPVLVLDLDILDFNIAAMAKFTAARGIGLRPHAKSHKSVDIARRQIAAGAAGICCAKLGEAEALAAGGINDLLITSPIVTEPAIRRLMVLNRRLDCLLVVADHPDNVAKLAEAARGAGQIIKVLVDVDPGVHRTGVATPQAALRLAQDIAGRPSLRYVGVQFYCGTLQHIPDYADRAAAVAERTGYLRRVVDTLTNAGSSPAIVTGGGTGTHHIDATLDVLTEVQPGSYIFLDRQYCHCDLHGTGQSIFGQSLQIDSRVVSANTAGRVTIDAGIKAMATMQGLRVF